LQLFRFVSHFVDRWYRDLAVKTDREGDDLDLDLARFDERMYSRLECVLKNDATTFSDLSGTALCNRNAARRKQDGQRIARRGSKIRKEKREKSK